MKKLMITILGLSVASILFYAFTGLPLWAPSEDDEARAFLLAMIHVYGVVLPVVWLIIPDVEKT